MAESMKIRGLYILCCVALCSIACVGERNEQSTTPRMTVASSARETRVRSRSVAALSRPVQTRQRLGGSERLGRFDLWPHAVPRSQSIVSNSNPLL